MTVERPRRPERSQGREALLWVGTAFFVSLGLALVMAHFKTPVRYIPRAQHAPGAPSQLPVYR
ncbi:MAG: hypothetical protein HY909_25040 [Deltaproteobacteria bacterium]|nr:hypothetical protein [Deltaproteobacteria bacterium]